MNRYREQAVRPDSTRDVAQPRPQTHGSVEERARAGLWQGRQRGTETGPAVPRAAV